MIRVVIVLFFLFVFSDKCLSQAETFIDGLPYVCEMFIDNDDLYFTSTEVINDYTNIGRLLKINLLSEELTLDTILEIPDVLTGIYLKDDFIYYSLWSELDIFRLSLNDIEGIPDTIFSDLYLTGDIEIVGSDLFVIASQDPNLKPNVLKFDLDSLEKEPVKYFEGFWPIRIYCNENHIYVTTRFSDLNIQRIDLSDTDAEVEMFVDSLFGPTALIVIEDNLYFADNIKQGTATGRVIQVNLDDSNRELTTFIEGFIGHHELVYHDDYLYISEVLGDKISRFKLPITTGLSPISRAEVSVYPNPVINVLNIKGVFDTVYNIYSFGGKKISTGSVSSDSKIDVSNLPAGNYILYLRDGRIANFKKM